MNYKDFIDDIINTRGRYGCGEEYHERHHIVPRCIGGTDEKENLIDLYAREHFIAHKLLAKENPHNQSLQCAWWMMSNIGRENGDGKTLDRNLFFQIRAGNLGAARYYQ